MQIEIGNVVFIKPNSSACSRTKNRIREHGAEGFRIVQFNPSSWLFGNSPAVRFIALTCLASDGAGGKESWSGWLPLLEVEEVVSA